MTPSNRRPIVPCHSERVEKTISDKQKILLMGENFCDVYDISTKIKIFKKALFCICKRYTFMIVMQHAAQ